MSSFIEGAIESGAIISGVLLAVVSVIRAGELIFAHYNDPTLTSILTLLIGAFVTAVTAQRVRNQYRNGNGSDKGTGSGVQSGPWDTGPTGHTPRDVSTPDHTVNVRRMTLWLPVLGLLALIPML